MVLRDIMRFLPEVGGLCFFASSSPSLLALCPFNGSDKKGCDLNDPHLTLTQLFLGSQRVQLAAVT